MSLIGNCLHMPMASFNGTREWTDSGLLWDYGFAHVIVRQSPRDCIRESTYVGKDLIMPKQPSHLRREQNCPTGLPFFERRTKTADSICVDQRLYVAVEISMKPMDEANNRIEAGVKRCT